jgi:hypothetical protein
MADMPAAAQVARRLRTGRRTLSWASTPTACAMDAMDIKHQELLHPSYIKYWNLQPVSTLARETHSS